VDEILDITCFIATAFERLGLRYLIGGSLASSLHGIPRSTQDVDIVVEMDAEHVTQIAGALGKTFYVDEDAMREAVARRASFNVIHLASLFKADIFVAGDDEPSRLQLARRQRFTLDASTPCEIFVATREDVVLQKLRWFRLGDGVSDRQWQDALGVLKVAGGELDLEYLRSGAALLGVGDLLRRICEDAGVAR
jgi:hypothetical protein